MHETERIVDGEITLVPYDPSGQAEALAWYQDRELCRQVDNIDRVYTREVLNAMYTFLHTHGECWFIRFNGVLVGDVSLREKDNEIAVVICREYQNRQIGRRCIREMLRRAEEKGETYVTARIYSFNTQSQRAFRSAGFRKIAEEEYRYDLTE